MASRLLRTRLVMAGGGTTWLGFALYAIARRVSVQAAVEVARVHLINWQDIGTQPYARLVRSRQTSDNVIGGRDRSGRRSTQNG